MYGWRDSAWWGLGSTPSPAVSTALQNASLSSGVPLSLLQALAQQESSFNPSAVSSKGAQGLLQLMPATGASLGVSSPFDPNQNASAGAQYLKSLYDQYGDWNTALIAYNEGPGNLASQGVFPSSQTYADTILQNANLQGPVSMPSDSSGTVQTASTASSGDFSSLFDVSSVDSSASPAGLSPLAWAGIAAAALVGLWAVS